MIEIIIVAVIVVTAAVFIGRSLHKAVNAAKPPCACGTTECPLTSGCARDADGQPVKGCALIELVGEDRTTAAKS